MLAMVSLAGATGFWFSKYDLKVNPLNNKHDVQVVQNDFDKKTKEDTDINQSQKPQAQTDQDYYNNPSEITVTTNRKNYRVGEPVVITIENKSKKNTYGYFGHLSLTLERYNDGLWKKVLTPWIDGLACGAMREMPEPRFLKPINSEQVNWDRLIYRCENNDTMKPEVVLSGKFRFVLNFMRDDRDCQSSLKPHLCWHDYTYKKKWHTTYSNEFLIE